MAEYCKILIVDDEFLMRQGIKHMVDWEAEGFQIVGEAGNGREALEMLEQVSPHIILSDMVMPLMNGIDFTSVVKEKYPDVQIIILSGYDDFAYVKNVMKNGAVDYILKPTLNPDELLYVLQKTAKNIPGIVLKKDTSVQYKTKIERYLLGYENDIVLQGQDAVFQDSCFVICGVQIKKYNDRGQDMSGILYGKIETWLTEKSEMPGMLLYLEEKTACLIFNFPKKDEEALGDRIKKLSEQLHLLYGQLPFIKSVTLSSLEEVKNFYQEVMIPNLEKGFYYKGRPFLELKKERNSVIQYPRLDYNQFSSLISQERYRSAMTLFFQYIHDALSAQLDEERLKNQAKNVLYNLLDTLNGDDRQLEEMRQDYFKRIDATSYAEDFVRVLELIESELTEYIQEHENSEDIMLGKIMDYIAAHYNEDLDLKEVAEVFNFNYSYLSTYFNQRITEGFSGYLNKIRIEKACQLLKKSDMTIAQISDEVGYSEQSYFCRVFKKMVGKSPLAWKKQQFVSESR